MFPLRHSTLLAGISLIAMLGLSGVVGGTEPELPWVHRHYGSLDGLPVSSASSARIDADGFLWLATHDGLARFDGQRFDVHESMRFPAMSGNRVLSLHRDPQQRLFAHTAHGDWLAISSGRIERVPLDGDSAQNVRHVDPESLCVTTPRALHCPATDGSFPQQTRFPPGVEPAFVLSGKPGTLWMMTLTGELWLHQRQQWQSLHQAHARRPGQQLPRVALAGDDAFWTQQSGRLLRITTGGAETRWLDATDPADILQLRLDMRGLVWVGAANGVFVVDGDHSRRVFVVEGQSQGVGYLSWQAPDGALWISQEGRLWRFASPEQMRPDATPILTSAGSIQDLLFAEDGAAWVMTLHDGIHRLSRARVDLLDEAAGLNGGNIYGVTRDRDGTMWLGSLGNGLIAVERDGNIVRHGRDDGLPGDHPWLVAAAPDGSLHVGTYAPGLWRRQPGESRFSAMPLPVPLRGEQVLAIVFDASDRLWLGTTAGAWRRDSTQWTRQWPPAPRRLRVSALAMSGEDVWFGSAEGVWRQRGDSGHAVAEALLARTSVRDLYLASDGALWISTDGRGLIRVAKDDPAGLHAIQLGRAQGLPSNSPHTVREDAHGHLWVNSNQGIFRISRQGLHAHLAGDEHSLSPLVLGLADGLTELEGNGGVQPAAAFDDRGRLWFPSQRGVVRFNPLEIPLNHRAPRPVIDGLESDGRMLHLPDTGSLPRGVRSLLIRYGASDLNAGSLVRFRHRLLPAEQGWSDAFNGRSASFASLHAGQYRFELLAGNSDGIWSETPVVLDFEVPPYWYETPAFRFGVLAAATLLVMAIMRLRLRRLRLHAAELDHQVQQRTAELQEEKGRVEATLSELAQTHTELARTHQEIEESNLRLAAQAQRLEAMDRFRSRLLADVSHELRTPVMLVSLPLQELQARAATLSAKDRSKLALSLKQLERLSSLVEQLVGLVQAESGQMPLRVYRLDLVALLHDIVSSYAPMAEHQNAELLLVPSLKECVLFGDRGHLTTVFGNLIDNAIKHTPSGGRVTLRLYRDDAYASIEVRDQGPGFDSVVAAQLFERFFRAEGPPRQGREGLGIGLALARELVELHGGRISANSAPGTGATFRVDLPLGAAHVALNDLALTAPDLTSIALPEPMADRGQGRVLLVEDHPDLAAYLAERLGEHLPVTCVGSAEQAMSVLKETQGIGLLISDVMLPGASGIELCRCLSSPKPDQPALPVILISAKASDADRQAGLAAGASAYLAKPFSFETLLHEIARAWPAASPRVAAPPSDPGSVEPLLAIALKHLGEAHFAIPHWAELVHLSERQLRRRVNELTGQSPQTWLREQRLLRVRHLLRSGECKTLAEAGSRCGLDNPSYLYRSYRARFGEN